MNMYREVKEHIIRKWARKVWAELVFSGWPKRNKWIGKLNEIIHDYAFKCEHTHTFMFDLPANTPWYYKGEHKGEHDGLAIVGCYLCGKMKVVDYKA